MKKTLKFSANVTADHEAEVGQIIGADFRDHGIRALDLIQGLERGHVPGLAREAVLVLIRLPIEVESTEVEVPTISRGTGQRTVERIIGAATGVVITTVEVEDLYREREDRSIVRSITGLRMFGIIASE